MGPIEIGWFWLIVGLSLVLLEFIIPKKYCIWIGGAALLTSLMVWAVGFLSLRFSFKYNFYSFACFFILALFSIYFRTRLIWVLNAKREYPFLNLNEGDDKVIGHVFPLKHPIHEGIGTIQVDDDTFWRVQGPDLPAGTKVRVLRREGILLIVEPVSEEPENS